MKINELKKDIIKSGKLSDNNVYKALQSFLVLVEKDLRDRAPVDSGDFRDSWESTPVTKGNNKLSAKILNSEIYASAIEFGSAPGEKPWPSPGPKTVMSGGRIYSSQAVGGTIGKALSDKNISNFAKKIAGSIIMAFKL